MANTARGYPYPLSTDPVAQGATAIQNLAQAVNDRAGTAASGSVGINVTNVNNAASVGIVFPAGRFSGAPQVLTTVASAAPQNMASSASAVTASGATLWLSRNTTGTSTVMWSAVQV